MSDEHYPAFDIDAEKSHEENSGLLVNSSDSNEQFLRHYKRKFQYDETSSNMNSVELNSYTSTLFTQYSCVYDQICSRCICVSSILRNFSFMPDNQIELVQYETLIYILSQLLLIGHDLDHSYKTYSLQNESVLKSSNDQVINDHSSKVIQISFFNLFDNIF